MPHRPTRRISVDEVLNHVAGFVFGNVGAGLGNRLGGARSDAQKRQGVALDDAPQLLARDRRQVRAVAEVVDAVKSLEDFINAIDNSNETIVREMGKEPFVQAREIAVALLPYLRRLPLEKDDKDN